MFTLVRQIKMIAHQWAKLKMNQLPNLEGYINIDFSQYCELAHLYNLLGEGTLTIMHF